MDDDLFQFEPAGPEGVSEDVPELVLGKKKKKKKKKNDEEAANDLSEIPSESAVPPVSDSYPDDIPPELSLGKSKKKKKKGRVAAHDPSTVVVDSNAASVDGPANDNEDVMSEVDLTRGKKKEKETTSNGDALDTPTFTTPGDEHIDNGAPSNAPTAAFAALDIDDDTSVQDGEETLHVHSGKKKKKKKKKALVLDPVDPTMDVKPLKGNPEVEPEFVPELEPESAMVWGEPKDASHRLTTAEKKKTKKDRERLAKQEKNKQDDDDIDAILAELGEGPAPELSKPVPEAGLSNQSERPSQDSSSLTTAQKKRLKKKKATVNEASPANDIDTILAELAEPDSGKERQPESKDTDICPSDDVAGDVDDLLTEFAADSSGAKKKSKKKKKESGTGASKERPDVNNGETKVTSNAPIDDVDTLLAELSEVKVQPKASEAIPKGDDGVSGGNDVDDLLAELAGNDAPAVKKKSKKKKKKGGAKADDVDGTGGGAGETDTVAVPAEGKKKKESAIVRKMREAREKILAEEERQRKLREEEEARVAAEEKRREEEARKKEEEKAKKKAAEKARRERKRQEGTLLSKTERQRRRKAEAFKKQLMQQGMIPAAMKSDTRQQEDQERSFQNRKRKSQQEKTEKEVTQTEQNPADIADVVAETQKGVMSLNEVDKEPSNEVKELASPAEAVLVDWDEDDDNGGEWKGEKSDSGMMNRSKASLKPSSNQFAGHVDNGNDHDDDNINDEEEDGDDDDNDTDDGDDDDDDDDDDSNGSEDSEYEGMSKAKIASEKRAEAFRRMRAKQKEEVMASRSPDRLRSPVICILGHVDTGKTKILDKIRRTNVQDGEAGGITQQIGATYFPIEAVKKEATKLKEGRELPYNVPSLLIIDTPGHESFTNLRSRGSSLCDIAILVVDIMHGLEPQTRESIDLLKLRRTPFIVALNKIDRIYDWNAQPNNCPSRDSVAEQPSHAREEFYRRVRETKLEFAEIGFNTDLYWDNNDVRRTVSLVPTSAITGEGIPDLLMLLLALPQRLLNERLMFKSILEATVLEVKVIEGLGTTIDIILTGGTIHEGDTIVVVGLDGPIVTTIRALLTPHPMKELRVKGQYLHHKEIQAAQGVKISADGLEKAVAGTQLMVVEDPNNGDELEYVRDEVMQDFQTILTNVDKSGLGVYVQASTLGSLEALLQFLRTSKIPVSGINIGPVHKRDVTKASTMLERCKEFATILAFDVNVEREARELAEETGVKIFTADIIYHLFDQFTAYMNEMKKVRREQANDDVVFPSICKILPQHVYNKKDPIVVGVDVVEGVLRVGTPLVVKKKDGWLDVGRVASIELNKKQVVTAKKGESVAVKIQHKSTEHIMYGRHFDVQDALVSKMNRTAIDLLKESFRDDLETDDWRLVVKLKKMFEIM